MADNNQLYNSVAPLRNVSALASLIDRVQNRSFGLDGLAVFYGPSGFGKTTAATWAANNFDAVHIEIQSVWTRKNVCEEILTELGIPPEKTISYMVKEICKELVATDRILMLDEADFLVKKGMIELVRDIYKGSGAAIILIGEENLPTGLQKWERVDGRILERVGALPACIDDVRHLAKMHCPGLSLNDDFSETILQASNHSLRRVVVNLNNVKEFALRKSITEITAKVWGSRKFSACSAPVRRAFA